MHPKKATKNVLLLKSKESKKRIQIGAKARKRCIAIENQGDEEEDKNIVEMYLWKKIL